MKNSVSDQSFYIHSEEEDEERVSHNAADEEEDNGYRSDSSSGDDDASEVASLSKTSLVPTPPLGRRVTGVLLAYSMSLFSLSAVVELCEQAGAPIPNEYRSMMRLDVVPPAPDEVDLVT